MKKLALSVILMLALVATACQGKSDNGGKPVIFASTIVWGSVAKAVGGDLVDVHSAITSPDQDPHDYEATADDKLQLGKAKIVLVNGGGYDDWADKLAKEGKATLIDAVDVSELDGEAMNEHVFYSLDIVAKVAQAVSDELVKVDGAHADTYKGNTEKFVAELDALKETAGQVGEGKSLTAVATEPVVGHLLDYMDIKDITPEEFVEQAETSQGPSAAVVEKTIGEIKSGEAKLLILNAQTTDGVSDKLEAAAKEKSTPIVKVHETFPAGTTEYLPWIKQTIEDFKQATANLS